MKETLVRFCPHGAFYFWGEISSKISTEHLVTAPLQLLDIMYHKWYTYIELQLNPKLKER